MIEQEPELQLVEIEKNNNEERMKELMDILRKANHVLEKIKERKSKKD